MRLSLRTTITRNPGFSGFQRRRQVYGGFSRTEDLHWRCVNELPQFINIHRMSHYRPILFASTSAAQMTMTCRLEHENENSRCMRSGLPECHFEILPALLPTSAPSSTAAGPAAVEKSEAKLLFKSATLHVCGLCACIRKHRILPQDCAGMFAADCSCLRHSPGWEHVFLV